MEVIKSKKRKLKYVQSQKCAKSIGTEVKKDTTNENDIEGFKIFVKY